MANSWIIWISLPLLLSGIVLYVLGRMARLLPQLQQKADTKESTSTAAQHGSIRMIVGGAMMLVGFFGIVFFIVHQVSGRLTG